MEYEQGEKQRAVPVVIKKLTMDQPLKRADKEEDYKENIILRNINRSSLAF